MIKIFGKIRYHWQPDLSWTISYWSLALIPLFISMILLLERLRLSRLSILLLVLSGLLVLLGFHRYFELGEEHLRIASANPFAVKKIALASIQRVEVTYAAIRIVSEECPQGQTYRMRKWPKKYFVNHLALHDQFQGEMILTDHLIKQDYFEEYYAQKATSVS